MRLVVCALVIALPFPVLSGCSRKQETQPGVATPSISFNHPRAPLGSPVDVTYRFKVAADAPKLDQDYRVMVHFLDNDEELMWTDDHLPPVPTSQWKAGQTVEYTRTFFVPIYPYIGDAVVQMGLYSAKDGQRLALAGQDVGQRAYGVGKLQLLPQTENVFVIFKDGWHSPEVAADNSTVAWQWTKKAATLAFRSPKRDSILYLHADNPGSAFGEPQRVNLELNGQALDSFEITPRQEVIHRTKVTAAQFGTGEMAEVRLLVDKTYVPALLPASGSHDPRELGIRVFHAFVEPQ
jgi:hypothetical protein